MSFYQLPHPWNPGYAIPSYVMAEPPERGTFTTQQLPRGTISALVPDFFVKPSKKLLGRKNAGLGSLGGSTLRGSTLGADADEDVTWGSDEDLLHEELQDKAANTGAMTNADVVKTLETMPLVPKPKRKGLTKNEKIALVAGVGILGYMLLKKKR